MTRSPARRFGEIAGTIYVALGIVGFALTGLSGTADPIGVDLLGLRVNPLHNAIHVLVGLALLAAAARSDEAARTTVLVTAAALGATGLLGLAVTGTPTPLALNHTDNLVHLTTAGLASTAWLADRRVVAAGVRG